MRYQCPYCPKVFDKKKYLDRHIARLHSGEPPGLAGAARPTPAVIPGALKEGAEDQKFEVKPPEVKGAGSFTGYHHIECGGPLKYRETPCPTCGQKVDWGTLNET